ncbi:Rha family transcriptional regulator [Bacillus vallismortis]|uniref:Rha family transcriptional regulator n=1 Tax=Bacillus vallismortis TaxID=72361 RepID=UPI000289005D|nr:Rha family transcriptional regulator [Bacillus vallismortis]MCY8423078.1 Rha family transcriptional regulator [Bacillus vallismortis]MEC1270030.1 Rha family transcriptional regulator [Bacillus vallismortis]MEC1653012.1 Rha family transcriptional regulator [Bacillus vallismortis]
MEYNLTVTDQDGQFLVDSREVAELIGKRHDHLLRDIEGYVTVLSQTLTLGADEYFVKVHISQEQERVINIIFLQNGL